MCKRYFHHLLCVAIIFMLPASVTLAINAPETRAGSVGGCPGSIVTVPVTVANFQQISAISLRLDINPNQLSFISLTDVHPAITGAMVNTVLLSSTLKKIMFSWSSVDPVNLNNQSVLFKLNFTLISGNPVITFNNTANGGGECEYADVNGETLNDLPSANFYFAAQITNLGLPQPGNIAGNSTVCQGQTGVSYSIDPMVNASGYNWVLPTGATISAGENTHAIEVSFSPSAQSGNLSVSGTNTCGTSPSSQPLWIQVETPPAQPSSISGPVTPEEGSVVSYAVTETAGVSYFWEVPQDWTIGSGQNSGTISVTVGALSGSVKVTPSNNCGAGPFRLLEVSVPGEKWLTLQLMLEGLFNPTTGLMNKARNESGDQYGGDTADMVVVELRQPTAPFSQITSGLTGALLTNGQCVVHLEGVAAAPYYIVLKPRNHLETWSASPVSFTGMVINYDFTTSENQAFGSNQKMLSGLSAGLYCGDTDGDGYVDNTDLNAIAAMAALFLTGYVSGDLTGDGVVDALDLIVVDNQISNGVTVMRP